MSMTPMGTFPGQLRPYTNITPFTYRDGITHLEELSGLRAWISDVLVPHLDNEVSQLSDAWAGNVTDLDNKSDELRVAFEDAISRINTLINGTFSEDPSDEGTFTVTVPVPPPTGSTVEDPTDPGFFE